MEISQCPTLQPSWKEFRHFQAFVEKVERDYKNDYGMVKVLFLQGDPRLPIPFFVLLMQVVPPPEWKCKFSDYALKLDHLNVSGPIEQNVFGKGGIYQCLHIPKKSMTLRDYREKAAPFDRLTVGKSADQVQSMFWKSIVFSPPLYGADLVSSLMDERSGEWNLNRLDSLLRQAVPQDVRGVTTSYCYVGSWKALFCWHKQDLDLSAINYVHEGKSKFWYSISQSQAHLLEREAHKHFPEHFSRCAQHFRHKTTLINPYLLKRKIPELKLSKAQQRPGEFMLVLGGSYHCGFNFGYNIAEAINYATLSWLQRLPNTKHCTCSNQSVRINTQTVLANLASTPFTHTPQYKALQSSIKKLRDERSLSEQKEEEALLVKSQFSRKIRKQKRVPRVMRVKGEDYQIEQWAECQRCKLWRKVKENYGASRFYCRLVGKQCTKKQRIDKDMILL